LQQVGTGPNRNLEPFWLVGTIDNTTGVAETFNAVIDKMTHGTDFKLSNLLLSGNRNLTHEDLNTSIDEQENGWNMHLVS
jgi:hypothetical protein